MTAKVCSIAVACLSACSTRRNPDEDRPRAPPSQVLSDCQALKAQVEAREKFFRSMRGEVRILSGKDSTDLDLALMTPAYLRAEVTGPLGIRLGLIQINPDWVQFYDSRHREVHRLPFKDFARDSERRERYLQKLPVLIPGPFFLDLVLSRSGLQDPEGEMSLRSCAYRKDENIYRFVFVTRSESPERNRWHRVDLDPNFFFPLRHLTVLSAKSELLKEDSVVWNVPEWDLRYSGFTGQGVSTLPRRLDVFERKERLWNFEWVSAEPIEDRGPEIFQWRPAASATIKDY